jgi:hypothetical protein
LNFPGWQSKHAAEPGRDAYFPDPQMKQDAEPEAEDMPAAQGKQWLERE